MGKRGGCMTSKEKNECVFERESGGEIDRQWNEKALPDSLVTGLSNPPSQSEHNPGNVARIIDETSNSHPAAPPTPPTWQPHPPSANSYSVHTRACQPAHSTQNPLSCYRHAAHSKSLSPLTNPLLPNMVGNTEQKNVYCVKICDTEKKCWYVHYLFAWEWGCCTFISLGARWRELTCWTMCGVPNMWQEDGVLVLPQWEFEGIVT